jgi:predicted signal transduction protein with EAL and GGDEF domain
MTVVPRMTVAHRRLPLLVAAAAAAFVVGGLLVGSGLGHGWLPVGSIPGATAAPPTIGWLAAAILIVSVAQLARLRVRVGTGSIDLAWGEAAAVVLCGLLPAPWVPVAMFVGVGGTQFTLVLLGVKRDLPRMLFSTAALTTAGGMAALFANAVAPTYDTPVTGRLVVALCAGAVGYAVTGAGLMSMWIVAHDGGRVSRVFRETVVSKLVMLVGNVAIGVFVVTLYQQDRRWLLLLPPGLWLLHQIYAYRLRSDSERRTWQTFSEATRELNRLDEHDAAVAGVLGALRLFPAQSAELILARPDGSVRGYVGDADGSVAEGASAEPLDGAQVSSRALLVGGVRVGELRLRLRSAALLSHRDHLMFAAYGDALAAALHDAVTHQELRTMTERTSFDAVHDAVTGVANRAGFLARGDKILRLLEPQVPVGLLLLDIDHFKEVNDTLGHAAGDQLLQTTATRLTAALRPGELLARLGGDEFGVLITALPTTGSLAHLAPVPLPGSVLDPAGAQALDGAEHPAQLHHALTRARSLAEELAAPSEVAGVQLSVEASVGVAAASAGTVDMTELMRRADIAMYQAKRGGSSVAWYDTARDDASTDRLALLAELREALCADDQLTLLLQPAIELSTGRATGVEALVRWQHPRRGTLAPAEFVTTVEHSELVGPFTRYVIERALSAAQCWFNAGFDLPVAVNLSPRSLLDPRLPEDVAEILARRRIPASRLVLEITETVVMSELAVIDQVLAALRDMGVQLAVDDFGTGYSSLTFLTRVPVSEVKVDRAFVGKMVDSPEAAAIVRTTVDLARELGLRVVAEGVETAEQRSALVALGCTAAQGFHFFKPMPADRVVDVLRDLARAAPVIPLRAEDVG